MWCEKNCYMIWKILSSGSHCERLVNDNHVTALFFAHNANHVTIFFRSCDNFFTSRVKIELLETNSNLFRRFYNPSGFDSILTLIPPLPYWLPSLFTFPISPSSLFPPRYLSRQCILQSDNLNFFENLAKPKFYLLGDQLSTRCIFKD